MNECLPAIPVGNNAPFVAHSLKVLGGAVGPVRGLPCAGPFGGPAIPQCYVGRATLPPPAVGRRCGRGARR